MSRVWFITGTSRGLGREWTIGALERGDRVAATARDISTLADLTERYGAALLPIALDVTDRDAAFAAVATAHEHFGRVDVVINNAAYSHYGFVEELTEAELRAQMETNFFGPVWITQAALPYLRAQRAGHLIQVSSIGGVTAFPYLSAYHASKWALEGFTQSLAGEVAPFGIRVTLIEPGGFNTGIVSRAPQSRHLDAYSAAYQRFEIDREARMVRLGDPRAAREAIMRIVDADTPPLRIFLGDQAFDWARDDYEQRLTTWQQWQQVAVDAHGRSNEG